MLANTSDRVLAVSVAHFGRFDVTRKTWAALGPTTHTPAYVLSYVDRCGGDPAGK